MKLYKEGAYLVQGNEIILEAADAQEAVASKVGRAVSKEEARENTILTEITFLPVLTKLSCI